MYVSRLDRPWRETPFLFQGFHVAERTEIEQIKEQTRHVYILVPDEEIEVSSIEYQNDVELEPSQLGEMQTRPARVAVEDEIPAARQSHQKIAELVQEIESAMDSQQELDMPRVKETVGYMVQSVERNPDAYVWLTRIKRYSTYAYNHSLHASVWATAFGHQMNLEEGSLNDFAVGALLMDVGFTKIPNEILQKTSRLTAEEWETIKTHVQHGMDMLAETPGISTGTTMVVATHHERLDGSGYPRGLRGNAIPLLGQMAGIVDFYTAITLPRPFMKALSPSAALQLLYKQRGTYFTESLVNGFIQTLSTYPTGSLVELNTGEVGIVLSQNPGWLLRPRIIMLLDPDKKPYGSYPQLNLLEELNSRDGRPIYITRSLAEGEYGINIDELSL